jgi:restriction system protein
MKQPIEIPSSKIQFASIFGPVINALRSLGGSGTIKEVVDTVARDLEVPESVQDELLSSGVPKFQNQIQWARLYLVREGLMTNTKRGVWSLTEAGQQAELSLEDAKQIFKRQSDNFRKMRQLSAAKSAQSATNPVPSSAKKSPSVAPIEEDFESDASITTSFGSYREEALVRLKSISSSGFERFCQGLLREAGFSEVHVTGRSNDGGIDGHGTLEINPLLSIKVLFQCKRYKDSVSPKDVRDFRGAMSGRSDKGIFLTTGTFTQGAYREASRDGVHPIDLINAQDLLNLMERFEYGLKPIQTFKIDDEFFQAF